jgi:hypothetical protein
VEAVVYASEAHYGEHAEAAVLELGFPHPVQGRQRVFRRHSRGSRHHLRKVLWCILKIPKTRNTQLQFKGEANK